MVILALGRLRPVLAGKSVAGYFDITGVSLNQQRSPAEPVADDAGGAGACKWIENDIARPGKCQNKSTHKLLRKLAGMSGLLGMAMFDVSDVPHIRRVLAKRVSTEFAFPRPFVMSLPRVLLRHADRIDIEMSVVTLRRPDNRLVPARQTTCAMKAVIEGPDDPVTDLEAEATQDGDRDGIERDDLARCHI